jgi:hypothetical protein
VRTLTKRLVTVRGMNGRLGIVRRMKKETKNGDKDEKRFWVH